MLKQWLRQTQLSPNGYVFNVYEINEIANCSEEVKNYLGAETLNAYRAIDFLKANYKNETKEKLLEYLEKYVFPTIDEEVSEGENNIRKITKQGDFGELLAIEVIKKFRDLEIPLYKFRWKINSNRTVYCTDIFAHNKVGDITDLKYYEVKTKTVYDKQIGVEAHNSLKKDLPTEAIADFLSKEAFWISETLNNKGVQTNNPALIKEAEDYLDKNKKYNEIVKNSSQYKKSFEIVLIIEKSKYKAGILDTLNDLPPDISPLEVSIILVNDLKGLVDSTYASAINYAVRSTYE